MKLDFVVPGFNKCGTTSLCSALSDHPDIFIPEEKETSFFAFSYWRGWEWYERFFRGARSSQLWGEGTQYYSTERFEKESCERILNYFPNVRLIFIARNPIARLESFYRELHHSGHILDVNAPYSIADTLESYPHVVHDTLYWQRISTYRRHFPDSRIHVLFLEDLARQPTVELAKCFEFLGVDPSVPIANNSRKLNSGATKLYDSKLMRLIRVRASSNRLWEMLPVNWQNRLGRAAGLRRPFKGPVQWDAAVRDRVLQEVAADHQQFLEFYGKPPDFWTRRSVAAPGRSTKRAAA